MNLLTLLLGGMLMSSSVNTMSEKTGISGELIKKLLPLAIPLLLKYMTSNASSQGGAQSLLGALGQHKSTDSIDAQLSGADIEDGGKIVGHILGNDNRAVTSQLAGQSGLSEDQVSSLLSTIAPLLLSGLSAANSQSAAPAQSAPASDPLSLMGFGAQNAAPVAADDAQMNGSALLSLLAALAK